MQRFMITDTSDVVRKVGKRILSELDFLVSEAGDAREALMRCEAEIPDYLIVDAGMEGALGEFAGLRHAQPRQGCLACGGIKRRAGLKAARQQQLQHTGPPWACSSSTSSPV